jgi:hypothetical protein
MNQASPRRTRRKGFSSRQERQERQERQVRIRDFFFAPFAFFAGDIPIPAARRFERLERLERFERLEQVHFRYFGGTGTTVPQFLQVRSFSSLENFW